MINKQQLVLMMALGVMALGFTSNVEARVYGERQNSQFKGLRTNQVLGMLRRQGLQYGAAHRNEQSLMTHQFYGRREDPGYSTTGRRIVGQQISAKNNVKAATAELRRRMQNIADPRERQKINGVISKIEGGMRSAESRTRATMPYLNVGGANYKKSW